MYKIIIYELLYQHIKKKIQSWVLRLHNLETVYV